MKKENKRKSNLKLLLLLLLLTTVLLVSSTYAWFTANKTVAVTSLDVTVEAKNGLQISADGINWKTILQLEDLQNATTTYSTATNQIPEVLEPVSTGKTVTSGKLDMFYGETDTNDEGDYILTSTKQTDAHGSSGRYIAFDIFLKTTNAIANLNLTSNSKVVFDAPDDDSTATSVGLENAARVAFLIEGNVADGATNTEIQALSGATAATTYIWEPNYDVHTAAGVSNAYSVYGITTSQTGGSVLAYNGVISEFTSTNNVLLSSTDANYFAPVTPTYTTPANNASDTAIFGLSAGITKVRVYMWVEGQDVDCENNASGSNITYTIEFTNPNV